MSSSSRSRPRPRVSAGARIVAGARAPRRQPAPARRAGRHERTRRRGRGTEPRDAWGPSVVEAAGAPALTRAARGYESASTSTSTSKSTDDADRAKPPPKKDYRRNRRPKAGGAAAKPRYNRPPLHDPSSSADAGADEDSPRGGRPAATAPNGSRTSTPEPPASSRSKRAKIGGFPHRGPDNDDKTKMNANNPTTAGCAPASASSRRWRRCRAHPSRASRPRRARRRQGVAIAGDVRARIRGERRRLTRIETPRRILRATRLAKTELAKKRGGWTFGGRRRRVRSRPRRGR